jgi:hypothetical protein
MIEKINEFNKLFVEIDKAINKTIKELPEDKEVFCNRIYRLISTNQMLSDYTVLVSNYKKSFEVILKPINKKFPKISKKVEWACIPYLKIQINSVSSNCQRYMGD